MLHPVNATEYRWRALEKPHMNRREAVSKPTQGECCTHSHELAGALRSWQDERSPSDSTEAQSTCLKLQPQ